MQSPNGQTWELSVDNNGNVIAKPVSPSPLVTADSTGVLWTIGVNPDGTIFTAKTITVKQ